MGKNATKAIVMLLSGKIFSLKKLSTGGGRVLVCCCPEKFFGLLEHYCPWPPKKHGSHGATEIIAPRISSWQSGIIKQPLITEYYTEVHLHCFLRKLLFLTIRHSASTVNRSSHPLDMRHF